MVIKKNAIYYGIISVWGIYGGVRGWNFYNKDYELQSKKYERHNQKHPTIYPEKDRPTYYYITRCSYSIAGSCYYILPFTGIFAACNEIYRAEVILRNMNASKIHETYYNPFYPMYRS